MESLRTVKIVTIYYTLSLRKREVFRDWLGSVMYAPLLLGLHSCILLEVLGVKGHVHIKFRTPYLQ